MLKKTIILGCAICLLCLLGACNLPDRQSPGEEQEFEEALQESVLQTLDAIFAETQDAIPAIEILTNTPLPLDTSTPEPPATVTVAVEEATETPLPTDTTEPTFTPTPVEELMTGPISTAFLTIYFDAVVRRDYGSAWNNLTPAFQERRHGNSLQDYIDGYEAMKVCDISVSNPVITYNTGTYARISAHFIYETGAACTVTHHDFIAHFVYSGSQQRWLLDGLTYP
jgi:hypothetical protein